MEVFSVFATLSLVDLLSGPLGKVKGVMGSVGGATASLGTKMGNLALAMGPVALGAGLLLGAFGMAATSAMAFESAMADVAKVVNFDTQAEFTAMSDTVKEMAGRIPMAADGIAAIIAAAGQSGVAKADLAEFAEQAAKMGVALGKLTDAVRWVVDTPFGQWIVGLAGGIAAALVGVTALAAALWFFSAAGPMLGKALAPLKVALLGLGWPILSLIAAVGLLYVAYQNNFGGIADTLNRWWNTISLVARGVIAIFQNLTGSSFELRGALAQEIHAAGLEELVVNVARIVYRIKEYFAGIGEALNIDAAVSALTPAIMIVGDLFNFLGDLATEVFGRKLTSASSKARGFGQIVGTGLSWYLEALATVITNVVRGVDTLASCFLWISAIMRSDWATAIEMARHIWDNLCASFMSFADLFRIGDWIRNAWAEAQAYLAQSCWTPLLRAS